MRFDRHDLNFHLSHTSFFHIFARVFARRRHDDFFVREEAELAGTANAEPAGTANAAGIANTEQAGVTDYFL